MSSMHVRFRCERCPGFVMVNMFSSSALTGIAKCMVCDARYSVVADVRFIANAVDNDVNYLIRSVRRELL